MTSSDQGQQINAQTSYLTKYFRRTGACNYTSGNKYQYIYKCNLCDKETSAPRPHMSKAIQTLESVLHPRILDNNL